MIVPVVLFLFHLGKTWSLPEGTCANTPGEEIPRMNAVMNSSTEGYTFHAGELAPCQCNQGYDVVYMSCMAVCGDDGHWRPHKEVLDHPHGVKEYACVVVPCEKDPMDVIFGSYRPHEAPGAVWMVGDKVVYTCDEGYMQLFLYLSQGKGDTTAECIPDGNGAGKWIYKNVMSEPKCVPAYYCTDPPLIPNAELVSSNGSRKYSQAVYACSEGYRLVGDGTARCLNSYERVTELWDFYWVYRWMFVPECQSVCPTPGGIQGDTKELVLRVTECLEKTTKKKNRETCQQPVKYKVMKTESDELQLYPGFSLKFQGGQVCIAIATFRQKYQQLGENRIHDVGSQAKGCESTCIDPCDGFDNMITEDTLAYKDSYSKFDLRKTIFKFETTRCKK